MLFSAVLVGLLAEVVASAAYSVPVEMIAEADCTLPAQYTIGDFTTFGDKFNGTSNTTTFHFTDSATGIDTSCQRNSSSKSITPGRGSTPRWPCDNSNVEFIYQANGLTVIEAACPERGVIYAGKTIDARRQLTGEKHNFHQVRGSWNYSFQPHLHQQIRRYFLHLGAVNRYKQLHKL
ncbi:uncharacterized protein JN550_007794 [Neoarthrinium moseri]|uniref:uncharacterized protein n=1 Tax=Neoarthrinium moseri TaxID=1658444 RepID=UPI001FDDAEB1|nr:uncharacterized protein JN550_007794 [Neoarthrinium moseri]KAI1866105.1 hypothetical protein JN550_007794 [Neoarthrinium moseri]